MTRRRRLLQAAIGLAGARLAPGVQGAAAADAAGSPAFKTLRFAFLIAETGFDPVQVSDVYSRSILAAIFDPPLEFEFLARPYKLRPNTLAAMPEVSDDYKTYTFRLKPGIYFADDPAFGGKPRELVAEDYVYTLKRHYDPRWKSPNLYQLENVKLLGLSELRRELAEKKLPFDYARPVEGAQVIDRYTWRIRLGVSEPRFLAIMTDVGWGAMAREVVEAYGDKIMEHPVGTGPFKLGAWRRASRVVLDRNRGFRDVRYDETAPPGDAMAAAAVENLQGKRLPLVDRVEISIIEEAQPRWLAFVNNEHDIFDGVPAAFADLVLPNNRLAPNLAKRGIRMLRYPRADIAFSYFNMEDPVVGGYTPDKIALRRAIALGVDIDKEIRLVRKNQAIPAQSLIGPEAWGYDAAFHSEMSEYDPARAKALLDLYGYIDRDGDGWREQPDGKPLVLEFATQPDQQSRQFDEQWQTNMKAIGIRVAFRTAKWPENLKASTAGKLMMWVLGWTIGIPDCDQFLSLAYGPNKGQANKSRFDLPAYNRAYERQKVLPNGPERQAAIDEAKKLHIAYMPFKVHVHRIFTDLAQPWVVGYHRNVFAGIGAGWRYVDIDTSLLHQDAA
ncbi:MAG: bicyclomycin resistance protein [Proteobacteria bacterium]|nr:bicyclomycin resistance protein [Pseudomonadota bacterium]